MLVLLLRVAVSDSQQRLQRKSPALAGFFARSALLTENAGLAISAFGPRAGQKVLSVHGVLPGTDFIRDLCADISEFSLHAAVRRSGDEHQVLKQLYRYINPARRRPTNAVCNATPQARWLKLKTCWATECAVD